MVKCVKKEEKPMVSVDFCLFTIFTARKRSLGQFNMFTGVCLSTGGGCLVRGGACSGGCSWGGVPGPRWGLLRGGGAWSPGSALGAGGVPGGDPPTATAADGTHPTGMHSCF